MKVKGSEFQHQITHKPEKNLPFLNHIQKITKSLLKKLRKKLLLLISKDLKIVMKFLWTKETKDVPWRARIVNLHQIVLYLGRK